MACLYFHDVVKNVNFCGASIHSVQGACAEAVGVKVVDSLDEHGLEVFHPFYPSYMLDKRTMDATSWI
uniref:GMC_oxred_C domain-containing protein n=1 Tax=Mesocestoides corti TaxID=53468 RepID=A0A5K3G2P6_MESCO